MNTTSIFINVITLLLLVFSFIKNKEKTKKVLLMALKAFIKILPVVLTIIIFIGLLMGFVSTETLKKLIGEQTGFLGILIAAIIGAIMHIPSLIAFPLASSLLIKDVSITVVAVFITTLTMIGFVTLPLEIKELGKKIALLRNGLSFIIAILIGIIMGVIL